MLKLRILTALVLLPVAVVTILWLPDSWFQLVVGVTLLLGCWEWTNLVPIQHPALRVIYLLFTAVFSFFIFMWSYYLILLSILFWLWGGVAVLTYARRGYACGFQSKIAKMIFGVVAVSACFSAIVLLRGVDNITGLPWLLMSLFVVISADVGAFFTGKLWGRALLAERVSPKKTWAGFWGGLGFAMLISLLFSGTILLLGRISWLVFFRVNIASLATILFSVFGDLFESVLKREANIKDSGNLLPGHGGVLDRIDSILAAMPVFFLVAFF